MSTASGGCTSQSGACSPQRRGANGLILFGHLKPYGKQKHKKAHSPDEVRELMTTSEVRAIEIEEPVLGLSSRRAHEVSLGYKYL